MELARRAEAQLLALPGALRVRMERRLNSLLADPRHAGTKALGGTLRPLRSLRVGDYRAIYLVDDESAVIRVTHIGHRSRVYTDAERGV
jgi:addiction module RelE/StbE family toxin